MNSKIYDLLRVNHDYWFVQVGVCLVKGINKQKLVCKHLYVNKSRHYYAINSFT